MTQCSVSGCEHKVHSRTLCSTHYSQHRKAGSLAQFPNRNEQAKQRETIQRPKPVKRRLWAAEKCSICDAPPMARGLCGKHYQQAMASGNPPPKIRVVLVGTQCVVPVCVGKAVAHGYCQRHAQMKRRYGLTTQQMIDLPDTCEACGSAENPHIDHCHAAGIYRGVLCSACNTALGLLDEDVQRMYGLIKYIETRCSRSETNPPT